MKIGISSLAYLAIFIILAFIFVMLVQCEEIAITEEEKDMVDGI
jgi:hypothetical protein